MKLRQQLQKLGYSHSFTTEEKGAFNHLIKHHAYSQFSHCVGLSALMVG